MKKILASLAVVGLAASLYGQGIILENPGPGLVYMPGDVLFDGLQFNLGVTISAGATAGSLAPIGLGTYTAANDPKMYTGADMGKFALGGTGTAYDVAGVASGGTAWVQLQIWYDGVGGLFANYTAAANGGGLVATVLFQNPTAAPLGIPPTPPQKLSGMPDVHLAIVPEPSTLALGALGLASLLAFRRRS